MTTQTTEETIWVSLKGWYYKNNQKITHKLYHQNIDHI